MKRQADIFLGGEADAFYARNHERFGEVDPVCDAIDALGIKPARVLEVGCADGWRVRKMRERYGAAAHGIDPLSKLSPFVFRGTALSYPFDALTPFDCIIFGFCLYLIDRDDLFAVAAEADRFLADGGHLIIHDFAAPLDPFARKYEHCEGVLSYHMDYPALWLAHPWYRKIARVDVADHAERVTVLRKNIANAFPVMP